MPPPQAKYNQTIAIIFQTVFIVWLIAINVLYYTQFKAMFLARFGSLVRR